MLSNLGQGIRRLPVRHRRPERQGKPHDRGQRAADAAGSFFRGSQPGDGIGGESPRQTAILAGITRFPGAGWGCVGARCAMLLPVAAFSDDTLPADDRWPPPVSVVSAPAVARVGSTVATRVLAERVAVAPVDRPVALPIVRPVVHTPVVADMIRPRVVVPVSLVPRTKHLP